jgi:hypothetical protein
LRYDSAVRAAVLLVVICACARDPVGNCPQLGPGDLVITEVRGDADFTNGPWIELFNATGASIDLQGIRVRFRSKDGHTEFATIVRRSVEVPPGGYVVLGKFQDGEQPAFVAYGFASDYQASWLADAAIEVDSCEQKIDVAQYDILPDVGTFSLGSMPPDADQNDFTSSWCTDPSANGTPGAPNIACPMP